MYPTLSFPFHVRYHKFLDFPLVGDRIRVSNFVIIALVFELHQLRCRLGSILQRRTTGFRWNWSPKASGNAMRSSWTRIYPLNRRSVQRRSSAERPACGANSSMPSASSPEHGRELQPLPNVSGPTKKSTAPKMLLPASKSTGKLHFLQSQRTCNSTRFSFHNLSTNRCRLLRRGFNVDPINGVGFCDVEWDWRGDRPPLLSLSIFV